ncbi:MAG: putative baseplate assembly protein [Methylobacterium sp.]|nr:putative baseplate assembly protein [Methylobacterium sp.]
MSEAPCHTACGCCEPPAPAAPALVSNRPGLSALAWRPGTYATFRQAMLEALASGPTPPPGVDEGRWRRDTRAALAGLTSREDSDFAILLIDLFAAMGDVLAFYSERYANEMFLRTAQQRDSLLRLTRLIGYAPPPGLAATAALAFTLDKGAITRLRQGLKVMSIPGQDEQPQPFETLAELIGDYRLNDLPAYGAPSPLAPFAAGERHVPLLSRPEPLLAGQRIVIVGTNAMEIGVVEALEALPEGERLVLRHPVAVTGAASVGFRLLRELSLFGHDVPTSYTFYDANPALAPAKRWKTRVAGTDYPIGMSANALYYPLDRAVEDLETGALLLFDLGLGAPQRYVFALVERTQAGPAHLGPLSGNVTHMRLTSIAPFAGVDYYAVLPGIGLPAIPDLRATRVFQLARPAIVPRAYAYPAALTGASAYLRADHLDDAARLTPGRRLLLSGAGQVHAATLTEISTLPAGADGISHHRIGFAPPLPAAMPAARLNGNVSLASHGETQPEEALGHGDAGRAFARFRLQRKHVTHLANASAGGPVPELTVRVNGERWDRVPSLFGHGPNECIYTLREDDEGHASVTFGDGVTGARLPSGASNITARYRTGLGRAGRLRAGQLATLLERPPGLRGVSNPLPSTGDADPGTREAARLDAPGSVRAFGRAISLADFEVVARETRLAALALASWAWVGLERGLHLTVAGAEGARLDAEAMKTLRGALDARRDVNHPLLLGNLWRVPVVVAARLLRDPGHEAAAVERTARAALADFLAFARQPPARPLHLSQIMACLQGAPGVRAVDVDLFHIKGALGWSAAQLARRGADSAPVQANLRLFDARPLPPPGDLDPLALAGLALDPDSPVLPAEQAFIADPESDVTLNVVEVL